MLANLLARMRIIAGAGLIFWSAAAVAEWELNMPQGVTPISQEVYDLHMLIFWICVVIGVVVFGAMFYSIIKHRKSKGAVASQFHESTTVELAWTFIPLLILVAMAVPATQTLIKMEDTSNSDLTITVTGYQWKWKYDYLDEDISFFSSLSTPREEIYNLKEKGEHYLLDVDNPLVLPVGKKIRILTTAADVIHAWWVPDLGWKRDSIPGYVNENWTLIEKAGTYRGQCTELCGKDHGFMPIVVIAKPEAEYQQWVKAMKGEPDQVQTAAVASSASRVAPVDKEWSTAELSDRGAAVYKTHCVVCHQADGQGMLPTFPAINGSVIATGPIEKHIDIVMNGGKNNPAMRAFANELSDLDLAAVITYQRNAWDNKVGDTVQPAHIKALRQ